MHEDDTISNPSRNPHLFELFPEGESRRRFLQKVAAAGVVLGTPLVVRSPWGSEAMAAPPTTAEVGSIGFTSVPLTGVDQVTVPPGYTVRVMHAWGDPISSGPAIRADVSDTSDDQLEQVGMHHDGLHFFPFVEVGAFGISSLSSTHGLLVVNHEYTDDGLLFIDGRATWTAEKVRKSQAAHGVSIVEVRRESGQWKVVRPSVYARRISAFTPISVSGPAAGNALLRTAADPKGDLVLGTANNCAMGFTPWGTYLTCEENFNGYFVNASGAIPADQLRYGISAAGFGYRWHEYDARFDARRIRTKRTGSATWSRSIPGIRRRRRSSAPRSDASSTKGPPSRSRRTVASWSTWATTSVSSTSTSSSRPTPTVRAIAPRT